jgi:Peptidase family M23/Bacterial tandem repeat domain 1
MTDKKTSLKRRKKKMERIKNKLNLLLVVLTLATGTLAIEKSKGVYRIPYTDGTKIKVGRDHTNHSPKGRIDMNGTGGNGQYKIVAAADGTIRYIEDSYSKQVDSSTDEPCTNNYVWIEHGNGEWTKYSHMQKDSTTKVAKLKVGQFVKAGTFLGNEGKVGCAGGDHLHFEVAEVPNTPNPISKIGGFVDNKYNVIPRICGIPKGIFESGENYQARKTPGNVKSGAKEFAKHGLPAEDYQCQVDQAVSAGYELEWVDGFDSDGDLFFNVVFRPRTGGNSATFHNLNSDQYQSKVEQYIKADYRISQVESYKAGNEVRYAVIFKKESGPAVTAYHGNSEAEHQNKFDDLTKKGWRPINISVVSAQGQLKFTALYEKTDVGSFLAKSSLTPAEYQEQVTENKEKGRQIAYLNSYIHNGKPYFTAIWHSKINGAYKAKHGLSGGGYQTEWESATGSGLLTRNVTGYSSGNSILYAGVWRK